MAETRLQIALEDIRIQSGFDAAILTDLQGLLLAETQERDVPESTMDVLMQVALQVSGQAAVGNIIGTRTGESEFFDWDGRRIVCRWFEARRPGILVILVPKGKSYKWAVGRMVKEIQRLIGM